MRLAAQAKGGYYPAPPEAVALAASLMTPPDEPFALLDPCAGKGAAIAQLAQTLGGQPHAIELDEGRALEVAAALPGGRVLAPASFLGCAISPLSFSLAWVNPPFDNELGGGQRVESTFLMRATHLLRTGGILALVCPESVSDSYSVQQYVLQWYTDIARIPFPEGHRPYNEVIVLGRKRRQPVDSDKLDWDTECKSAVEPGAYPIPPGAGPKRFEKTDFTDLELERALADSPLRRLLEPPPEIPLSEPPLPLANGHIALLLAAGKLDGVVCPEKEPPHVVRGTARKQQYRSSQTEDQKEDGAVVTKTVYSEKIILTIRALGQDGSIRTFE
jgi:hypothetical protein